VNDGDLLREALQITLGPRSDVYGHAADNLGLTVDLWNVYLRGLDRELTLSDLAALMELLKLARLRHSPDHYDTLLDMAGWPSAVWDALTEQRKREGKSDEGTDKESGSVDSVEGCCRGRVGCGACGDA
jgi:hypothetical protein